MHKEQKAFCNKVKFLYPDKFRDKLVYDFGSYDVNGNNRYLFTDCEYIGIDIHKGKNVDVVCPAHKLDFGQCDVVISTEMLEHDKHWKESLNNMIQHLEPGGLMIITCATDGRKEHGTRRTTRRDSPATLDYYHNIGEQEFEEVMQREENFEMSVLEVDTTRGDLYFYGIKK
ncbi:MAG: methyltransferase domain-containing protein [Salinimicrobium sediminis]|nr:methyltransferase domain-containing protein [Salinimicrobium sediminis]